MTKHHIDIVALQETHVNYTGKEEHGDFLFYFSSIKEDDHRKKTDLQLEELNQKVKTKRITAQEAKRERLEILNISAEKLGVGFVYRKSSFISLTINTDPLGISLTNVYAPHAGLTSQTKTDFYDSLAHLVRQRPPHQINLIEGSLEVKLPTIWTDEKQSRGEAERRGRLEERR